MGHPPKYHQPFSHRPAFLRWLAVGQIVFGTALILLAIGLYVAGDRTWWGTLLLFSPRWIFGLPLLVLIPLAFRYRRKWLWWDAAFLGVFIGPILSLEIPLPAKESTTGSSPVFRVVTCNLRSEKANLPRLLEVASTADALMLQECPENSFQELPEKLRQKWHVRQDGRLCIASRYPLSKLNRLDRETFGGWGTIAFGCQVESSLGSFNVVILHLETPREGLEALLSSGQVGVPRMRANTALREWESSLISQWIALEFGPCIVAGDFNMPVESRIYQRYWSDFTNAFSQAGLGFGFTKYTRWHGVRIDHILLSEGWLATDARVLPDVGSDHRPLLATLRRVD